MGADLADVARFDDALPPALFDAVSGMALALSRGLNPSGTFWQDLGAPVETAIAAAVARLSRLAPAANGYAGAEWWVRLKAADTPMAFHFDKDESQFRLAGRMRHPTLSSVLYLTDAGGPTIILGQSVSADGRELIPPEVVDGVLSNPRRNSFLVFPGALRHGVVADGSARDGRPGALRGSLLLNWWSERPMAPGCGEPPAEALTPWAETAVDHLVQKAPITAVGIQRLSDFAPV